MPWAGLVAGSGAWLLHHQLGSDLVYWECRLGGPLLTAGLGLVCVAVAVAGVLASWRAAERETTRVGHRFAGTLAASAGLLFALVIVAQSLGGFFYAGCQR